MTAPRRADAVIVGAGFAGLYMLKRLRDQGLTAIVLERGDGVGGTWYWNRYPGAKCDVESPYYSYSFDPELDQEWNWTTRYPAQGEILAYLNHVADRFELRPDVHLNTTVNSATFDEQANEWQITSTGPDGVQTTHARFCILATGSLSESTTPKFEGIGDFAGPTYHTGNWPHEYVDFTNLRIGVIGTGSSGIQVIPEIAKHAKELLVFQRTPNFSVPANNHELDDEYLSEVKARFPAIRERMRRTASGLPTDGRDELAVGADAAHVKKIFDEHWTLGSFAIQDAFADLATSQEANDKLAHYIHDKIEEIVADPEVAERLKPRGYPVGSKRMCVDSNYYETFNLSHVHLVDVRETPISRITRHGVATTQGEYELDAIVFATGFDAMTGAILKIDIRGRGGASLRDHWEAGPRTYLGVSIAGFPNLFSIAGPGSPSVLTNVVMSIEQHVEWIDEHIAYLRSRGFETAEALPEFEEEWIQHVNEVADQTLLTKGSSWYLGANVPGKPRVFMPYAGGLDAYRERCNDVAEDNYRGYRLA
ncbi:flavin-containing monooxygenase [Streptomyces carpinensis]|uniref:NAD(P)/FAD-dependent oxidoreductase n=1 Tax=Streptomyces carpinensis TaxID=66369 RepID=A0ABV1VV57_9ACTN|nr:NAD(P)/FAD-dependent oxidoreductase [Streptomyces carpinensis]